LGSIKIICDKYEVYSNEELVQLTQKEYKLLHYLISNKGIVCSRNQIIEDVWDIHFEYDTGVIDVFMNAIRKKLHLSKDDERLKTIRGIGFIANDY
jgi:DNA-binding response OmpR family regulator